jgi:hypothetical protein
MVYRTKKLAADLRWGYGFLWQTCRILWQTCSKTMLHVQYTCSEFWHQFAWTHERIGLKVDLGWPYQIQIRLSLPKNIVKPSTTIIEDHVFWKKSRTNCINDLCQHCNFPEFLILGHTWSQYDILQISQRFLQFTRSNLDITRCYLVAMVFDTCVNWWN